MYVWRAFVCAPCPPFRRVFRMPCLARGEGGGLFYVWPGGFPARGEGGGVRRVRRPDGGWGVLRACACFS